MQPMKVKGDLIGRMLGSDSDDDEEDLDRFEWQEKEIARLPYTAVEIACFEDEVDHSPGLTWQISCTYYAVPIDGEAGSYALIVLDWDDNWGRWEWEVQGAVKDAPSIQVACKFLMAQLARERISGSNSSYDRFLQQFL